MAAPAHEAAGGAGAVQPGEPSPAVLSWPLPGCRPDSLADLFSARTLAELARAAGAAGGAVALDLGGHTLHAPAGGRPMMLQLLESGVPPAGLRSLILRNGTLALRPGMGLAIGSRKPFAVCLEHVKLTRPAPSSGSSRAARAPVGLGNTMVAFYGPGLSGRMVQCRVELSPAGPAGDSMRQAAVGVCAGVGAHVVLEDVDVVARQGASRSFTVACAAEDGARVELNRCVLSSTKCPYLGHFPAHCCAGGPGGPPRVMSGRMMPFG
jgi:hypothetical protein